MNIAKMATRRVMSLIAAKFPYNTIRTVSLNPLPRGYQCFTRRLQTVPESTTELVGINEASLSSTNHLVNPKLYVSKRHDLATIFNCKVCGVKSTKIICRESYEKGIVIARCNSCDNLHLISDKLGLCGEPSSMEEFVDARGEEVKKKSLETLNLTLEDLAEISKPVYIDATHKDHSLDYSSKKPDLTMVFNCKVCGARSVKAVFTEAYEKGVVIARCNACDNLHLIADRLGLCAEPSSMEDLLAARGEEVEKKSLKTFNLKPKDLAAKNDL